MFVFCVDDMVVVGGGVYGREERWVSGDLAEG